jgi:riboflavin biosynthesis pyrimidine reductase
VRQLLPDPVDPIDPIARHAAAVRPRPPGRPWVACNMVASVDGATAVDGVSGPLGGTGDRAVFTAVRAVADVILAAAGTVRAEGYGPPRTPEQQQEDRLARGQQRWPRIAVVTRSLDLDLDAALFTDTPVTPIVITTRDADAGRRAAVAERATVITAGDGGVDLPEALGALSDYGDMVLCEGGPSLNGQLAADGLIDEICLTMVPTLANGRSARIMHHATSSLTTLRLAHLWEEADSLFFRYVRAEVHQNAEPPRNEEGTTSR